jgi:hypothetical protein
MEKDISLISEFLSLQRKILTCCDDQPELVLPTARQDPQFRTLCLKFGRIVAKLDQENRKSKDGMIEPVPDIFIRQWRSYEEDLREPISYIELLDLLDSIDGSEDKPHPTSTYESDWSFADDQGAEAARLVKWTLRYFRDMADDDDFLDGISNIELLLNPDNIDIQGAFRRLELVPNLLVPQKVARAARGENFALYQLWADARRAFIFGSLLAAIPLVRAILEKLLRDFYKAKGENLSDLIGGFSTGLRKDELHRIRIVANAVLHTETKLYQKSEFQLAREKKIVQEAASDPEREAVQLLKAVRNLIERCTDS